MQWGKSAVPQEVEEGGGHWGVKGERGGAERNDVLGVILSREGPKKENLPCRSVWGGLVACKRRSKGLPGEILRGAYCNKYLNWGREKGKPCQWRT